MRVFSVRQTEHNDTVKIQMTETESQNLPYHKRTQIFTDKLVWIKTYIYTHFTATITECNTFAFIPYSYSFCNSSRMQII